MDEQQRSDPNHKGDIAEIMVIATLLQRDYTVLKPVVGHRRYDVVIETEGRFLRVQIKAGRVVREGTTLEFNSRSFSGAGVQRPYTTDEIDYFGIYCAALGKVYLVPVDAVGPGKGWLCLEPTRNNQVNGIRWAKDFEI
jgi:PD-(D/E)XK endonuclease